jgi:hypothetical protein
MERQAENAGCEGTMTVEELAMLLTEQILLKRGHWTVEGNEFDTKSYSIESVEVREDEERVVLNF